MPTAPSRRVPNFTAEFISKTRKHIKIFTVEQLLKYTSVGCIEIAPFNRDEVKARAGNAEELMKSLSWKMSIGVLVAYSNGRLSQKELYEPSTDHKMYITDGGHRYRWVLTILRNEAVVDGLTLQQLEAANPVMANNIKNTRLVVNVTTHDEGVDLEDYAKEEYARLNTMGKELVAGEVLRASTDQNEIRIRKEVASVYSRRPCPTKRDEHLATWTSIACGLINPANLSTKKDILLAMNPTNEQTNAAISKLAVLRSAETAVFEAHKDNIVASKLLKRKFNLDQEGSVIVALHSAKTPEEYERFKTDYLNLHSRALAGAYLPLEAGVTKVNHGKKTWNDVWTSVRVEKTAARHYGDTTRYTVAWNKVLSLLHPAPPANLADIGPIETL